MTAPLRPRTQIAAELAEAEELAARFPSASTVDPYLRLMREQNEHEAEELRRELREATSSDLQVSLDGRPVTDHSVSLPFLNRVTAELQSVYRALARAESVDGKAHRESTSLVLTGTSPGSFRLELRVPGGQLELLRPALADRVLGALLDLLSGSALESGSVAAWSRTAEESAVRALIRLASALASSGGTTQLRWQSPTGVERGVALSSAQARTLAATLAGESGREIISVSGHLTMAQDDPPRVRIHTDTDEHRADVRDEALLDVVKELLFDQVTADIVVDMSTSPSTGRPTTRSELLGLTPAPPIDGSSKSS